MPPIDPAEALQRRRPKRYRNIGSSFHHQIETRPDNPNAPGLPGGIDQWQSPQWPVTTDDEEFSLGMPGSDTELASDRNWKSPIWQPRPYHADNVNRDKQGKFSHQWQSPRWKASWDKPPPEAEDERDPFSPNPARQTSTSPSTALQNGWDSPSWDDPAHDAAEWKEHEHPRDEAGKFTEGEGTEAQPDIPPPPQIQSKDPSNLAKQKHLDKLHQLANEGKWDEIEQYPTPGVNTYAKKVQQYKAQLLGLKPDTPVESIATSLAEFGSANDPAHFTGTSKEHGEFKYTGPKLTGTSLNGVEFKKFEFPSDWQDVKGQDHKIIEPEFTVPAGKHAAAGVLLEEPDGRVWIVKPTGGFGGYDYTFPKGTQEAGLNLQATAIKECYEESGLHAQITGFAGDFEGSTSKTRYYFAKRIGGTPEEHEWETDGVSLIPKADLDKYLNVQRDKDIVKAHLSPSAEKPSAAEPEKPKKLTPPGYQWAVAPEDVKSTLAEAGFKPMGTDPGEYHEVTWTGELASVGKVELDALSDGAWQLYDSTGKKLDSGSSVGTLKAALKGMPPAPSAKPSEPVVPAALFATPGVRTATAPQDSKLALIEAGFTPAELGPNAYSKTVWKNLDTGHLVYAFSTGGWSMEKDDNPISEGSTGESLKDALANLQPAPKPEAAPTVKQETLHEALTKIGYQAEPSDTPTGFTLYTNPETGIDIGFKQHPDKPGEPEWSIFQPNGNIYASGTGQAKLGHELSQAEINIGKTKALSTPKPAEAAPPTAAPIPAKTKEVPIKDKLDLKGMTKTGPQKGSNPGGQYTDADGNKMYAKFYQTDDHAKNEMLAAALFKRAGGNTLTYHPITDSEGTHGTKGKLGLATEWAKNLGATAINDFTAEQREQAQSDFALHVWLANWDATGSDPEGGYNLNIVDGIETPMDFGGSLLYRAMGDPKGKAFNDNATEWDTLRDPKLNANGAKLYGAMTDAQLKQSVDRLKAIRWSDVDDLVAQYGPGDDAAKIKLIDTLMNRRKAIIAKGKALGGGEAAAAEPQTMEIAKGEPYTGPFESDQPAEVTKHVATTHKQVIDKAGFNLESTDSKGGQHYTHSGGAEIWINPPSDPYQQNSSTEWSILHNGQITSGHEYGELQGALAKLGIAASPKPAEAPSPAAAPTPAAKPEAPSAATTAAPAAKPKGYEESFAPEETKSALHAAGFAPAPLSTASAGISQAKWQHPDGPLVHAYGTGNWTLFPDAGINTQPVASGTGLQSLTEAINKHVGKAAEQPETPAAAEPAKGVPEWSHPAKLIEQAGGKEWHSPDGKKHNIYFKGQYKDIFYDVNEGKFKGTKYSKHTASEIDKLGKELLDKAGLSADSALDAAINSFFANKVSWDSPQWTNDWHSPQWTDNLIKHEPADQMIPMATTASSGPPAFIRKRANDMIKQLATASRNAGSE